MSPLTKAKWNRYTLQPNGITPGMAATFTVQGYLYWSLRVVNLEVDNSIPPDTEFVSVNVNSNSGQVLMQATSGGIASGSVQQLCAAVNMPLVGELDVDNPNQTFPLPEVSYEEDATLMIQVHGDAVIVSVNVVIEGVRIGDPGT
jgi:hypothetical protein